LKKTVLLSLIFVVSFCGRAFAQLSDLPDYSWGNASYFDMQVGKSVFFKQVEVKLLKIDNLFNQLKVGNDTIWLKVCQRSQPVVLKGLRLFVADNNNLKLASGNAELHSLLTHDALICLCDNELPYLSEREYFFPISLRFIHFFD